MSTAFSNTPAVRWREDRGAPVDEPALHPDRPSIDPHNQACKKPSRE